MIRYHFVYSLSFAGNCLLPLPAPRVSHLTLCPQDLVSLFEVIPRHWVENHLRLKMFLVIKLYKHSHATLYTEESRVEQSRVE